MEGSGTLKEQVALEMLGETDELLKTVRELEQNRHHIRLFAGVVGVGVPLAFGVRAAWSGDPMYLIHALVVALAIAGFLWYSGRKYDRVIQGLDEEIRRITRPDS
jgi:hypothetical protein